MTKEQQRTCTLNLLTLKGLIESEIERAKHMLEFYQEPENKDSAYMAGAYNAEKNHLRSMEQLLKYTEF